MGDYWGYYTYSLTMQYEVIKLPTIGELSLAKPSYNPHQVIGSSGMHNIDRCIS